LKYEKVEQQKGYDIGTFFSKNKLSFTNGVSTTFKLLHL